MLDRRLARVLALADEGSVPRALQLDYDCPTRLLPRYATLLRHLRSGESLRGRRLWITSLVVHVRDPGYGALFRPVVDGHILQLFDTGDSFDDRLASQVPELLDAQGMPFMAGVASFERRRPNGASTMHRAWFAIIPRLSKSRRYRGVWVFPAGTPWLHLLPDR